MADHASTASGYLRSLQDELKTGHAQEHSYRPALKELFEAITGLDVVNEPKGSAHGRPDFIFVKNAEVPMAWAEAKDLHVSLDKVEKSNQMERYFGYANLILTNGLEFRFFRNGERYGDTIIIAEKRGDVIEPKPEHFDNLARTIADFITGEIDSIRSSKHLAKIMGGKARRLRDNIVVMFDPSFTGAKGEIEKVYGVLKEHLIHDLTEEQFADLYAQTLVYGLFVARYHDDTPESFSRHEARERIPASNHLLQQFFDHIAGANFEKRLSFIVDELCDVFVHANVHSLVHGLYAKEQANTRDPIIHFYEDFLSEYDPALRMSRGVFYTPLPVVRFIVRSADALLKKHFGLTDGLADRATVEWERTLQGKKSRMQIDRVQVLDPAVGTGTFLNEVIRQIHTRFAGQEGMWEQYANERLLPRLHGFELMMASYTIAHLKLSMTLAESGVTEIRKRLRVFLTNSLEEAPQEDDTLFSLIGLQGALTEEAMMAAEVKRDYPIMVVLGNPPYSVSSQNASVEIGPDGRKRKTWIGALLDDYKKDLKEKKLNLDDDYIKFIRFSHHLVEKNGQGIVAMITNNSFLDGITHRRMRESLLGTFDHIYVLDLHGNSKRKETTPDGGKDENVFDIMQGVGITLFVKTGEKKKGTLGAVHHIDLYGKREEKYAWLDAHDATTAPWKRLETPEPNFFFVKKDLALLEEYEKGLKINELFLTNNAGIKTDRDALFVDFDPKVLSTRMQKLLSGEYDQHFKQSYRVEDSGSYKLTKILLNKHFASHHISKFLYRPFDARFIYYDQEIISRPAANVMNHLMNKQNIALASLRIDRRQQHAFFVSDTLTGKDAVSNLDMCTVFPLYLYPDSATVEGNARTANLNMELLQPALKKLQLEWVEDGTGNGKDTCGPEDILDYIYAVLHSPTYRERYKEFLKIDFPRVPFTTDRDTFWQLVTLGREIRLLHLMESPVLNTLITRYPEPGSNTVEKVTYDEAKKRVYINASQYFEGIDPDVWAFPIGGYQPLQKWLKDRKGRTLTSDDLLHYQRIVIALKETKRLMGEVEGVTIHNTEKP